MSGNGAGKSAATVGARQAIWVYTVVADCPASFTVTEKIGATRLRKFVKTQVETGYIPP